LFYVCFIQGECSVYLILFVLTQLNEVERRLSAPGGQEEAAAEEEFKILHSRPKLYLLKIT
jgi:hypothetical protein